MEHSTDDTGERLAELTQLVSTLRHDINGALAPALLVADNLCADPNPRVQRAGEHISRAILRVVAILKSTRDAVPPQHH
jgi:hypothetical protein